jgi:hypothetical protein
MITRYAYKVYEDQNQSEELLVGYRGADAYDVAGFYCPYIPLGVATATPWVERISLEIRENQGGYFDAVGVFTVNDRHALSKSKLEDIAVWCITHWGPPGFGEPCLWKMDRELIFVHDPRMLFEIKLRWHGEQV